MRCHNDSQSAVVPAEALVQKVPRPTSTFWVLYTRKHEESSRLVLHQETMKRHLANVTICPVDEFEDLKIKLNTLSDVEWDGFVSRSLAEREALEVHAKSCDDWCQLRVHERGKELCSLKQGRLVSIRERLKGLGFCDAVLADDVILRIPGANRGKPLTEREWLAMKDKAFDAATNQVTLVKSLTRTRTEKIIAKEYTAWTLFALWSSILIVFERMGTLGIFQLLASEYSRDVMQKLFSKVPNHLRRSTPESTLALACVAFELSGGNAWRIAHLGSALLCKVLDIDDWTFAASASGVISDVIRRSGWDPSQMTLAELERENIRIQCASCVGTDGTMPTMTWRGSVGCTVRTIFCPLTFRIEVHHFREKHSHVSPADWRILFGTEKERYIMEVETPELKRKNLRYDWTCLLCRDILSGWSYSERAMLLHIAHACYMQDLDLAPETNVSALWNPDS
ncbi:uncharacterized protein EI90DRAFT_3011742 [Cantharellus anzutake]|uniref:uncharacterized protein n=1 Tax=Cantharellus anzutake TaxID=1750568 RepID=UPI00190688AC|nr:uncharacterized protein EI90DRAFT_3011742 [Cantharellus anzutake]KAF8342229.1 hypothetical protein EI90DRAFT_3011742 [Cantharellus anzutake]